MITMRARGRDGRDGEPGQVLAMTAIALLGMCALVGLAADTGFFFDYRRRMQSGADGAALAGAEQLLRDAMRDTNVHSAAITAATSNGFTDGADGAHVTVNHPPLGGFYTGNDAFVEAIITQPRPTIFMRILGFQSATVSTRAVAGIKDSGNCIYALNPTAPKAINLNGGANINANCGIVDDSNNSDALDASGSACITRATSIAVTGNVSGACFTPAPKTSVPREPDPLAGLAPPAFSLPCNYPDPRINGVGTYTLYPGVYCGLTIHGQGGAGCPTNVTLQPGTYVIYGGGLTMNGGCINGTGVTFYNTGTTSGTNKYQPVSINGNVQGALYAPTSGPMRAMLFFQDRAFSGSQANVVNGSTGLTLQGTLYFPTAPLTFAGGQAPTGAAAYSILIADTITFTGSSSFNDDFSGLIPDGSSPIKALALAE